MEALPQQLRLLERLVLERRARVEAVGFQFAQVLLAEHRCADRGCDRLAGGQAPGELTEQVSLRQHGGLVVARDCAERKREQWRRDVRVDLLVALDLALSCLRVDAEVEEGLPTNEPSGGSEAASQIARVGAGPVLPGSKMKPKNGLPLSPFRFAR
jgi:hypothetical protein